MVPSGLPTGTVSSGRDGPESPRDRDDAAPDARARIAELERENEALRAAVEKQRREHERIVAQYERLLDRHRDASSESDDPDPAPDPDPADAGAIERLTSFLGR
jgi:chromosome segregation ATPase